MFLVGLSPSSLYPLFPLSVSTLSQVPFPSSANNLYTRSVAWLDCSEEPLGRGRQVAPSRRIIPPFYKATPPALNM